MAYTSCRFYSKYLAHQTNVCLLIPECNGKEPEGEFPVLYLLHGRGDDCTSYVRNSCIERYAEEHRVLVVLPSGETGFYVDGVNGKRFFSYMTKELPMVMRSWFPVSKDPGRTYITGLSMGAYGALKIGLTYPERFAGIGIMSAAVRPDQFPDFAPTDEENDILHEDVWQAFGKGAMAPEDIPQELILARRREGRPIPPIRHYIGKQDMLYEMNDDFRRFALAEALDYRYEEWDGGHDWIFWDEALPVMLKEFFG